MNIFKHIDSGTVPVFVITLIVNILHFQKDNNFINNFNQLNMFQAIISPVLRSARLCLQLVV